MDRTQPDCICIYPRTRGPSLRCWLKGLLRASGAAQLVASDYLNTEGLQLGNLTLPRKWVAELFVYIGIFLRLLRLVRSKLLETIRILERLEGDLCVILSDDPEPDSPTFGGVEEIE